MKITTVCGDIAPEKLGFTTMHEHTITDMSQLVTAQQIYKDMIPPEDLQVKPENMYFLRSGTGLFSEGCATTGDAAWLAEELRIFKNRAGGGAVVDGSPIPLRGDVRLIRQVSETTGVHVIVATGLYYEKGRPQKYLEMKKADVYHMCLNEIENGIGGTGICPGFLKCGMSSEGESSEIPACEMETLRALARLASETGMSLHVHTAAPMTAEQISDIATCAIKECGMKADRLLMLHMDQYLRIPYNIDEYIRSFETPRTVDIALQCRLLDMGCNISFDSWDSLVHILPDNHDRLKALVELLRRGYGDRIVLGHDVSDKSHSASFGYTGYTGFAVNAIPKLCEMMDIIGDDAIDDLTYKNPARILAY
jgi:phosphotriesterase-related protein